MTILRNLAIIGFLIYLLVCPAFFGYIHNYMAMWASILYGLCGTVFMGWLEWLTIDGKKDKK